MEQCTGRCSVTLGYQSAVEMPGRLRCAFTPFPGLTQIPSTRQAHPMHQFKGLTLFLLQWGSGGIQHCHREEKGKAPSKISTSLLLMPAEPWSELRSTPEMNLS